MESKMKIPIRITRHSSPVTHHAGIAALLLAFCALCFGGEPEGLTIAAAQPVQSGELTATGRVMPRFKALIGSRLSGHITDWCCVESGLALDVGVAVKTGQKLFTVDQSTFKSHVEAAQAALASAEAALANLKAPTRKERIDALHSGLAELDARIKDREKDLARYSRLVEVDRTLPAKRLEEVQLEMELLKAQRLAAQAHLDEAVAGATKTEVAVAEARVKETQTALDAANLDLKDTVVKAPFDGVVTRRMKGLGDYVSGAPFVEVLELTTQDALEAELNLPEAYLAQTGAATKVLLRSPALKSDLELPVTRVIPEVDTQRGTFAFRVGIPPGERGALVAGSFVSAVVRVAGAKGVIVPQRAVLMDGDKAQVLVSDGANMSPRAVEIGNRLTEGIIIKSGLRAGESVVVGASAAVKEPLPLPSYLREKKQ
ncbi:MAG TPA: efflux RND transporter periplasmic adaptor subunit [Planctomycetota bacterium]|jgi:HlyD family secretion protein